jgi:hypothetical protein
MIGTQPTAEAIEAALSAYEAGPAALRAACAGLSSEHLRTRIGPGEWSILENAVHLLDSDLASTHRKRRIVAEENPLLIAYDENTFIARIPAADADLGEVLDLFALNRRFTARWLRTLPADAFARTGVHTQRGRITLLEIVAIYAHHVGHHLKFVADKRRNLGI